MHLRLPLLVAIVCIQSVYADLTFTNSYVRECTPLNVTWTPKSDAYPYSVYIMGIGAQVQSYQINSNFQPGASQLTYQYSVPQKTETFQALMIAVVDSKGNGNSSAVLTVNSNPNKPSSCSVYAATNAWFYASDSITGNPADRPQCGNLKYYPVGALRGTSPYSYSIIPVQGKPMTVNIPSSSTLNQTYFVFQSPLAFKQGTQFYQMASDATGSGSGGGSPIQTVGSGQTNACLGSNYKIEGLDTTHALPVGQIAASFENLPGAISNADQDGSSGSHVGGLIGGIIGAALGVGGILLIIALYLVYRRRQKRKRELERKEQPQFIDLDEDVFDPVARRRTNFNSGNGVRQSYSVSPFTYQDGGSNDGMALMVAGEGNGTLNSIGAPTSDYSGSALRHAEQNDGLTSPLSDLGYGLPNTTNSASQALLRNGSGDPWHNHSSGRNQNNVYSSHLPTLSTGSSSSGPFGMSAAVAGHDLANLPQSPTEGTMSSASAYVLRARNAHDREQPSGRSTGRSRNDILGSTGTIPTKSNSTMEEEERRRVASSRFVQHQDAGRLAVAPGTEEEELQEDVPPEYGQWLQNPPNNRKQ